MMGPTPSAGSGPLPFQNGVGESSTSLPAIRASRARRSCSRDAAADFALIRRQSAEGTRSRTSSSCRSILATSRRAHSRRGRYSRFVVFMPTMIPPAGRIGRDSRRYDERMLSPSFRWRISDRDAFLDYGPVNVAHVQAFRTCDGLTLTIRWQGKTVGGPVASIAQGVRFAERWIAARPGWPGKRPERWYDRAVSARRKPSGADVLALK